MEACLIESITTSLSLYMYRNAIFLCERLYAEFPSESNLHLLATCYFRSNQPYRAYHILKGTKLGQSRYLFALACYDMGNLVEAENALLPHGEPGAEVPNGAAGYFILGLICRYTDRRQAAIGHFTQALTLDPFSWSAYEQLCFLGAEEDASLLYGEMAVLHLQRQQVQCDLRSQHSAEIDNSDVPCGIQSNKSPYSADGSPRQTKSNTLGDLWPNPMNAAMLTGVSGVHTPFEGGMPSYATPSPSMMQIPSGTTALSRSMHGIISSTSGLIGVSSHSQPQAGDISPKGGVNAPGQPQRRKVLDEGKLRKVSGRLFSDAVPRRSTRLSADSALTSGQLSAVACSGSVTTAASSGGNGSGYSSGSQVTTGVSTSRGGSLATPRSSFSRKGLTTAMESNIDEVTAVRRSGETLEELGFDEGGGSISRRMIDDDIQTRTRSGVSGVTSRGKRTVEGAIELLSLLRTLGEGFRHLCMYRCQEALQAFMKLPQHHYATGWVLCQVGRAYFEMVDYPEAEHSFSWAHHIAPCCVEGSDVYSTVLYHMKKEVELSYLAQETIAIDRLSPQAWCVMGNCFSFQKDHEAALKFFQRALQLDPHFTYAHTLCGHEFIAMEDFDEAIASYRNAIRIDPRHYNAWYGLGTIYFRQEKFEFAEYHFRRALLINNRSSVLQCYLGMALHALKMNGEALKLLEQAIIADPKNPLPKYQKANVLMSEERYDDALAELMQLKDVAPRESSVFFLMGKICKRLNMPEQALHNFCVALDLKPSAADVNMIKTAIEKLHVPDELEEESL
eukprot:c13222_g1_i1 orf=51-2417(+)